MCNFLDLIKQASNTSFDDSQQDKNSEVNSTTQKILLFLPNLSFAVDYLPKTTFPLFSTRNLENSKFSSEKTRLTNSKAEVFRNQFNILTSGRKVKISFLCLNIRLQSRYSSISEAPHQLKTSKSPSFCIYRAHLLTQATFQVLILRAK